MSSDRRHRGPPPALRRRRRPGRHRPGRGRRRVGVHQPVARARCVDRAAARARAARPAARGRPGRAREARPPLRRGRPTLDGHAVVPRRPSPSTATGWPRSTRTSPAMPYRTADPSVGDDQGTVRGQPRDPDVTAGVRVARGDARHARRGAGHAGTSRQGLRSVPTPPATRCRAPARHELLAADRR